MSEMVALFQAALVALVIGHPVAWSCENIQPHAGWWDAPHNRILIDTIQCENIKTHRPLNHLVRYANAALVFTHEAEHAKGIEGEHAANCAAVADLPAVLRAVGFKSEVRKIVKMARWIVLSQTGEYGGPC